MYAIKISQQIYLLFLFALTTGYALIIIAHKLAFILCVLLEDNTRWHTRDISPSLLPPAAADYLLTPDPIKSPYQPYTAPAVHVHSAFCGHVALISDIYPIIYARQALCVHKRVYLILVLPSHQYNSTYTTNIILQNVCDNIGLH